VNLASMRQLLDEAGVRPDAYPLEGGLPDNRHSIERRGHTWYGYYSGERGKITWERLNVNEDEACLLLVDGLQSDPTTKWRT